MKTANEQLLQGQVSHAVDLRRYSENVVQRILAVLNRVDAKMFAELTLRLEEVSQATFTVERLEALLYSVWSLNREAHAEAGRVLLQELRDFTHYESSFQLSLLERVLPTQISVASVTVEQVYAAAMARPFQGALLKDFLAEIESKKARLIRRAVADGVVQGRTTSQIVSEIRGTRAKGYSDGIIEITRRDAQAVVRTAIAHTSAFAQQQVYDANEDLIKGYTWSATLDLRTSSPCRLRDGKVWTKDFKPIGHAYPWGAGPGMFHWACRSRRVPVLKSWKELTGVDIADWTPAERASMDGQVPAGLDYGKWLKDQPASRQDDVLGPIRGRLLREGGLSLDDMYGARGKPLTLEELRARDSQAFKRAGL